MAHNVYQEASRQSITVNKYEEIFMVWCNSYLTVHADRTIKIFEFSHDLKCIDKKINCLEYSINASETSPAVGLFKHLENYVKGTDLAQMSMDPALWPHSQHLLHEISDIIALEWSPDGILWNNDNILAVLNNVGHVVFYKKQRNYWMVGFDFISVISKQFKEAVKICTNKIEIIKKCAYTLETSAICWAPIINEGNSAHFVTAQKNGTIIVWSIKETKKNIEAAYVSHIDTEFENIIKILWIPKGSKVLLLCSNLLGQIFVLEFYKNANKQFSFQTSHMLWNHKDRMVISDCHYVILEDRIIYICNKNRHLLSQMLSDDCKILSETIVNINDYKITNIHKHENTFYVSTVNNCFYKIKYNICDDAFKIQYDMINIKGITATHELHGCSFSKNGVLLAVAVIDRKVLYRKENMKVDILYHTLSDSDFPELILLLENPTKRLTYYRDCIETLRFKIVKLKRFPNNDYKQLLLEGETDVYKLKVYLIMLNICNVLEENFKINRNILPENSIELIKEKIAKSHAKSMMLNLYERYCLNNQTFTDFEAEYFAGCKKHLEIINVMHKTDIDIPNEVLNLPHKDYNYICQGCDKAIIGYSCEDGHLNAFCSVTFTPIENEYLICKACGVIARPELSEEKPMCIYCDLYFDHTYNSY